MALGQIVKLGVLLVALILTSELAQSSSLLAGTRLRVRLDTSVATKNARPGDAVEATLIESIQKDRQTLLPQGSRLMGRVEDVRRGDKGQGLVAQLRLNFTELAVPSTGSIHTSASILDAGSDQNVDLNGVVTTTRHKDVSSALGAGSLLGSLIGLAVSRTDKAIVIGGIVGAALFGIGELASSGPEWQDFEFKRGRKLWLRLDTDTVLR